MRRTRGKHPEVALNLVPMMDALVTIIAFLMYTASFLAIVALESPIPLVNKLSNDKQINEVPLQLTLSIRPTEVVLYSPFSRIKSAMIPNLPDGKTDLIGLRRTLMSIKDGFPFETKIVFMPMAAVPYDQIIEIMDAVRKRGDADPPLYAKNPKTGVDEVITQLFPNIVFGNLLGGDT